MRKFYKEKHDLLMELLKPFEACFEITGENAGLHLLLTAKNGEPEENLIRKAAAKGVKVYGLSDSFIDKNADSSTVILGYGGMSQEDMCTGIERLTQAWLG